MPPESGFSTGIYSINRASEWLWLETHQNGQNVQGMQVRTPICHIVPVSRAHEGGYLNVMLKTQRYQAMAGSRPLLGRALSCTIAFSDKTTKHIHVTWKSLGN